MVHQGFYNFLDVLFGERVDSMAYLTPAYTAIIVDEIVSYVLDDILMVHVLDDFHEHFSFGLVQLLVSDLVSIDWIETDVL